MAKILIVDDEKNIRLALKQCLEAEKYDVEIAVNGIEGLDKILNEEYDVVLLDMKMPGLTGLEVLQKVRSGGKDVAVIMMTAYGTIEKAVEEYDRAKEYLAKSISMNTEAAEPHNLLGILFEYEGKVSEAQKHYRAALALDPTYRPANDNLERTAQFYYTQQGMNLGDEKNE